MKVSGLLPRVFRSSIEFFLLFWGAYHSQPSELNSRSRTMDRVQPLLFKCLLSDAIITLFKAFWFIIFTFLIVYFGVEMLEQSVKLSRLIIFYFISNFLTYAPILPKREPKTSAFRSVFVFRAVFQLLYSCFGRKSKCAANGFLLETGPAPNFAPFR